MQRLGCPLPCSPFTPPFPQHLLLLAVGTTHTTSGKLSPTGPGLFQPFQRSVRDFGTVTLTIVCSDHSTLTEERSDHSTLTKEPEPFPQSPASTVFPYNGFLFLRGFVLIPSPNTPFPNLLTGQPTPPSLHLTAPSSIAQGPGKAFSGLDPKEQHSVPPYSGKTPVPPPAGGFMGSAAPAPLPRVPVRGVIAWL